MKRADYYCSLNNKDKNLKGFNNFKSLYIKSIIENDNTLHIKALKGLIKCSKRLGIPHKEYDSELYTIIGNQKVSAKRFKKSAIRSRFSKKQKIKVFKNRLKKVLLHKGYVEFYFDYPLSLSDISTFILKKRGSYKKIYDVRARLGMKSAKYRLRSVKYLKIAQYKPTKVRIVFEHSTPFTTSYKIAGNKLFVYLGKKGVKREQTTKSVPRVVRSTQRIIVLDPGHGGKDSGAIGYKRKEEKDIVLSIAKRVYKKLKRKGYKVYMTRRGDYFVTLRERTKFANRVKANLFISIHANAASKRSKYLSMKGLETFYLSPAKSERAKHVAELENRVDMKNLSYYSKNVFLDFINRAKIIQSNKLAIDIQRNVLYSLRKRYKVIDGGVRPGPFWVLVGTQMPSILIEVGYITNPTEAMHLSNPLYQELIAEGIVAGVESYFRNNER